MDNLTLTIPIIFQMGAAKNRQANNDVEDECACDRSLRLWCHQNHTCNLDFHKDDAIGEDENCAHRKNVERLDDLEELEFWSYCFQLNEMNNLPISATQQNGKTCVCPTISHTNNFSFFWKTTSDRISRSAQPQRSSQTQSRNTSQSVAGC